MLDCLTGTKPIDEVQLTLVLCARRAATPEDMAPLDLPQLSADEEQLCGAMRELISSRIADVGGMLPFDQYMEAALYAPGLGYYVNGRRKFGEQGDFTTAPEISPLFSQCLAGQVGECLQDLDEPVVLEVGAGSGRMAADLLSELARAERLPAEYLILELSPSLQQLQRQTIAADCPQLLSRVRWLTRLPGKGFSGVVVANELLDAMPVHRFRREADQWQELFVTENEDGLTGQWLAPRSTGLVAAVEASVPAWPELPGGYSSEINLRLQPWLAALRGSMIRGYLLLIDYGYSAREYYHPERSQGTLICHYRHRVHADPYLLPGLQDITANVDFTAVALAGRAAGFELAGYTTQAHFLIDNGLDRRLAVSDPGDVRRHMVLMQGAKRLMLPAEMGERFKVMALALDMPLTLAGFTSRDLRDRL